MDGIGLIKLEYRQLRYDLVFWSTTAICVLALLFGLANGQNWIDGQNRQINLFEQQTRQSNVEMREVADVLRKRNIGLAQSLADRNSDPRYALGFEAGNIQHICHHPDAISALTVGQSDLYNACVLVSAWEMGGANDERLHRNLENPLRLLFGRFDATFVIISLLPIAILILTYNVLSGERELGTLSLLGCQQVTVRRIITARFAVRAVAFVMLTLSPLCLVLWAWGAAIDSSRALGELALWLIVTAGYELFWFACAYWVNALGKNSTANGLMLAGCWLLFVVVMPGCLNLAIKQIYPMPSRIAYIDATREATVEVGKKKTELLGKYLIDHPDRVKMDNNINVDNYIQTRMVIDEETKRMLAPVRAEFSVQQQRQQTFVERLRFLSPAIVYQQINQELTGQGIDGQRLFLDATENYHRKLRAFYFPRFARDSPGFMDYNAIPQFLRQDISLYEQLPKVFSAYAGLLIQAVFLALFGWRRMRRIAIK